MSTSVLLSVFEIVSFKKKKSPSHVSGPQECGHPFHFADGLSAGETRPVDGERRGRAPLRSHLASLLPCGGCSEVWPRSACGWRNGTGSTPGSVCRPGSTPRPRGLGTRSANWQVTRTAGLAGRGWARGRWPHPSRFHIKCIFQDLDFHTRPLHFHPLGANSHS